MNYFYLESRSIFFFFFFFGGGGGGGAETCLNKKIILVREGGGGGGVGWLVWLNDPLRQYFSLYRAVSQREGERKEKR